MSTISEIKALFSQLLPTGRAFKMPKDGYLQKLRDGLSASWTRAYDDANATLNSILPDNDQFTAEDAADWERRLGLISNPAVPLVDRMAAIQRKYNHPGTIKARQHYLYLQKQLRDAGFDVYVHENRFPYGDGNYYSLSPVQIDPAYPIVENQHSSFVQHGNIQHGGILGGKVANHIMESLDVSFNVGNSFKATFFIGGAYLGTYADVPAERKGEFRQIILATKPVQTVAFLFINFV